MSRQSNILEVEFSKWNNNEQNLVRAYKDCKCNFRQQEELSRYLENKIITVNQTKYTITQKVKLEAYNKFDTTNNIRELGELTDGIHSSCSDIKTVLNECSYLKQKGENNLSNINIQVEQKEAINKNKIQNQREQIYKIKEDIIKCNMSKTKDEKESFELTCLRNVKKEVIDNLHLLLDSSHKLKSNMLLFENKVDRVEKRKEEINDALVQKAQVKESISSAIEEEKRKIQKELKELDEKIAPVQERFLDINLKVNESKESLKKQICNTEDFSKQNFTLKLECNHYCQKNLGLQKLLKEERDAYHREYTILQNNIEVLSGDLQTKECTLLQEKEMEEADTNNIQLERTRVDNKKEQKKLLERNVNSVKLELVHLVKLNSEKNKLIEALSQEIVEKNNCVQNLKSSIKELEANRLHIHCKYENTIGMLNTEIRNAKENVNTRGTEIEVVKLQFKEYIDICKSEELEMFNVKKLTLVNEIENIKNSNQAITDEVRQLSIKLEGRTLESDIIARKIKTNEELFASLKEELKPKPPQLSTAKFQKKRQIDETSDSSFDGSIPFNQRMGTHKKK